jgi:hypothetical protein
MSKWWRDPRPGARNTLCVPIWRAHHRLWRRAVTRADVAHRLKHDAALIGPRSSEIRPICRQPLPAIATASATATTATTATTAAFAVVTTTAAAAATTVVTTATAAVATATTAAAAIAATAVATAATTEAATATAAEAAATTALLTLLCFIDPEGPTVESATIHTLDRLGGFLGGTHGHKGKAAGAAGLTVRDQVDIADCSELLERGTDAFCIGIER